MKPIIGINLDIEEGPPPLASVQASYFRAIQKAGGIPVLLPPMTDEDLQAVLGRLNGLLLIGGDDYSPKLYGEEHSPKVKVVHHLREEFDLRLIDITLSRTELPVLGICGGLQLLNIALGGSLIQDIATELPESPITHTKCDGCGEGFTTHAVRIEPGSVLQEIYNIAQLPVPTSHHQAVKELGKGLTATAFAEDGVIEAVELPGRRFALGVQWHPERDFDRNRALFEQFIKEASSVTASKVST